MRSAMRPSRGAARHAANRRRRHHQAGGEDHVAARRHELGDIDRDDRLDRHVRQHQQHRSGKHRDHRPFVGNHRPGAAHCPAPGCVQVTAVLMNEKAGRQEGEKDHAAGKKERRAHPDEAGQAAAEQRAEQGPRHRSGGQHAERPAGTLLRRLRRHQHHGARGVPAEQAGQQAQADKLVDVLGHADQRHTDRQPQRCAHQDQLAAIEVGHFSPDRRHDARAKEADAIGDPGPLHDGGMALHPELRHVDRQKGQQQRHRRDIGEGADEADIHVALPMQRFIRHRCSLKFPEWENAGTTRGRQPLQSCRRSDRGRRLPLSSNWRRT